MSIFLYECEFQFWLANEIRKNLTLCVYTEFPVYDPTKPPTPLGRYKKGAKKGRLDIWIPSCSTVIECKKYKSQKKEAIAQINYYKKYINFNYSMVAIAEKAEEDKINVINLLQEIINPLSDRAIPDC